MKLVVTRFSIPGLLPVTSHKMDDEERLAHKFNVFEKVTKPSVLSQTDENFTWHIFAGEFLRDKIPCEDKRMVVHYVTAKEFGVRCSEVCTGVTTVRLDDDDGISPFLLERLEHYTDTESIISFPKGRLFKVVNNDIVFSSTPTVHPNISAGMTRINGNIYACGNHANVHKNHNVVYDDLEDAYFVCCSEFCHSGRTAFYSTHAERFSKQYAERKHQGAKL